MACLIYKYDPFILQISCEKGPGHDIRKEGTPLKVFLVGLAAFAGGALVSWVNFLLLRFLLNKKGESGVSLVSPIRTVLSVAYLLVLYLVGKRTGLNSTVLLIGGALGLTVLLTFFTFRLTKGMNSQRKE